MVWTSCPSPPSQATAAIKVTNPAVPPAASPNFLLVNRSEVKSAEVTLRASSARLAAYISLVLA